MRPCDDDYEGKPPPRKMARTGMTPPAQSTEPIPVSSEAVLKITPAPAPVPKSVLKSAPVGKPNATPALKPKASSKVKTG
ncbi:hypothetical protein PF005_g14439 [Phytophthora fragariae]|uniref:Uncharacterized protein n=1 Tax=Phytophthora fragariae TaxID=53985 RepID=A0A6A3RRQ9_9STRA|nr:hypothetical protein PF003_g16842 [Phytophthora fragariae]KAE8977231.1 hypothetical protein PF011_g23734 [Phytophthora fragariae]KAE9074523.1 hypothetical protein PF010_g24646 [Phytophthora fragariae]KAE9102134.1 hypothetical protein PF007_g14869 [Phytophthora fragariae]KAE9202783.1 hypothetical protein PF005_g14439 [Phytophthora fragariae]